MSLPVSFSTPIAKTSQSCPITLTGLRFCEPSTKANCSRRMFGTMARFALTARSTSLLRLLVRLHASEGVVMVGPSGPTNVRRAIGYNRMNYGSRRSPSVANRILTRSLRTARGRRSRGRGGLGELFAVSDEISRDSAPKLFRRAP